MVDERTPGHDGHTGQEPGFSPGDRLREARERAGLGVQDLAERLHLSASIVEHLEADRYDDLPEPAYIRGYLRAAARALELDPHPLIAAFDAQGLREPALETPPAVSRVGVAATRGHRRSPYVIGLVILAVVAGLIGYGWFERQQGVSESERVVIQDRAQPLMSPARETAPLQSLEQVTPAPPVEPVPPRSLPEASVTPATPESGISIPQPEPEPQALPDLEPPATPSDEVSSRSSVEPDPAPVDADSLVLILVEDSWVEISDARDERLLVGLMREGTRRELTGAAPFRVFLGNAPGVRLVINGQNYNPSRHARSDNTARFVLQP